MKTSKIKEAATLVNAMSRVGYALDMDGVHYLMGRADSPLFPAHPLVVSALEQSPRELAEHLQAYCINYGLERDETHDVFYFSRRLASFHDDALEKGLPKMPERDMADIFRRG